MGLARASLLLSAGADVFVYATPYFPNNRPPGDSALILAASLVWYGVWLMYLWRSKRVRQTFSLGQYGATTVDTDTNGGH